MATINEINKIIAAWELASQAHFGQQYATAIVGQQREYLSHIGRVTLEIQYAVQQGADLNAELAIICAILHDTIEDTPTTYEEIKEQFGQTIAEGVLALTKNERLPDKRSQMLDSLHRIKQQSKEVWMVKMADRVCNLQAPPHYWAAEKKEKYRAEAILIYETLKEASDYLARRLKFKIEQY